MFGCVVAGRLVQTDLQMVDETHAVFELPAASTINHITVFLLGTIPFPEGFGATVHFHGPSKGFQLLGMLSNEKPSAIFRLRGTFDSNSTATQNVFTSASTIPSAPTTDVAVLGFSIEPLSQIQSQVSSMRTSTTGTLASGGAIATPAPDPTLLAEKIVKNLFNYVSGFVPGGGSVTENSVVPIGVIAKWYEKFLAKVKAGGVGFLDKEQ